MAPQIFDFSAIFATSAQTMLYRVFAMLVILAGHGYALALTARLMGDRGPDYDGRLSLNPLNHMEPIGALSMVLFRIGWIKPMAVDPAQLRGGRWGLFVVVLGSLVGVLALALVLWGIRPVLVRSFTGGLPVLVLVGLFETTAEVAMWFVLVNLVPIPPFAAGLLLAGFWPRAHRALVARIYIPAALFAALAFTGIPGRVLGPVVDGLRRLVLA